MQRKPNTHSHWLLTTIRIVALALTGLLAAGVGFAATCQNNWSFENVTTGFGGPAIEGVPAALTWDQPGYGLRDDIFARGDGGHLIHYFRLAGQAWYPGEDLTILASAPQHTITGDPVVVLGSQNIGGIDYPRHDVFALGSGGDLIHYWWTAIPPSGWKAENLRVDYGGPETWSQPRARNSEYYYAKAGEWRLKTDVYSTNINGDVVQYWWTRADGWNHWGISNGSASGLSVTPFEPLTVVEGRNGSGPAYHDIFGADLSGHLKRFWWAPNPGWQGDDLTLVNGIQTLPLIGSVTNATTYGSQSTFSVFGFQSSSLIRYFTFNGSPWDGENVTASFGFNGSSGSVYGRPAAEFLLVAASTPTGLAARYDLFARDSNDHLIHYWSFEPFWDFYNGNGSVPWQPGENLTTKLDGIWIGSDPQVASRLSTGSALTSQYAFARSRGSSGTYSLVSYCWTPSESWSSHNLQTAVIPFGDFLGDDPTVVDGSTEGLSVYARSKDGDLIHYYKP